MDTTVISPHFDDAILSCGSIVSASTRIVTVYAGVPGPETKLSGWDRICGFPTAAAAALARREEDDAACARAGAEPVRLPYLDRPYAEDDGADLPAALGEQIRGGRVYLPAAIGGHPDHRAVRDAGLRACRDFDGEVFLYADVPYACDRGWNAREADRPPRSRWDTALSEVRAQGYDIAEPDWRRLDAPAAERKLALAKHYRSQLEVFRYRFSRITEPDGELATEVAWAVAPAPRGEAR
ncbi:MAG TPA: PIG-L family deacetylase [Glycomyces sp.]